TFVDKGNRNLALRPEGTPGVVRAVLQYHLKTPIRLFYIGPMFRYERPQKGRYREFYQLGVEVIGEGLADTEIELISMAQRFFTAIGLSAVVTKINSVGCEVCRPQFRNILKAFLNQNLSNLCEDCKIRAEQNPLRVFDCKEERCQDLYLQAPKITDRLCYECQKHFQQVLEGLAKQNLPFELDKSLVRGLDYYTRTTFEFVPTGSSELGSKDSIGGGGRYDNLIKDFGGPPTPAIGFALGLERILLCLPKPEKWRKLVFVIALDEDAQNEGEVVLSKLRNADIPALKSSQIKTLRAGLGLADNLFCKYVIIIGSNELQKKVYTLKNLQEHTQIEISQDKLIEYLKNNL
ncbi:MAG: histidine--tRNA ligase, partial [candidate division WOR-3 bacterium]|nr:histidine--tRNA ligase [candidate division WOR-3 bacterium]MDW7987476.1 histidine--tRNA ligase [candidate division WOR-3 bacterium]